MGTIDTELTKGDITMFFVEVSSGTGEILIESTSFMNTMEGFDFLIKKIE